MLKNQKKCAHIALSAKNAPALRQMPNNAAHVEKPEKCGIFVWRIMHFSPRCNYLLITKHYVMQRFDLRFFLNL